MFVTVVDVVCTATKMRVSCCFANNESFLCPSLSLRFMSQPSTKGKGDLVSMVLEGKGGEGNDVRARIVLSSGFFWFGSFA